MAKNFGLKINEEKTKFIELNSDINVRQRLKIVMTNNREYFFEQVNSFNFLGVILTENINTMEENLRFEEVPNENEIQLIINKLKNNRSSGENGISAEIIK